jgi:hypothetical protein
MQQLPHFLKKKWVRLTNFFRENASISYQIVMVLTVSLALIFAIPSMIFGNESLTLDTPVGEQSEKKIDSLSLLLLDRKYNPEENYAEVFVKVQGSFNPGAKLALVVGEAKTESILKSELIRLTDSYYLIQIHDIPSKWGQLVIDIGQISPNQNSFDIFDLDNLFKDTENGKEDNDVSVTQTTYYVSRDKIPENTDAKPQNHTQYLNHYIDLEIEETKKLVAENNESRNKVEENNRDIEVQIEQLEADKKYQTTSEKERTESEINRLRSVISTNDSKISTIEETNNQLQEKIEKLTLQKNDLNQTTSDS